MDVSPSSSSALVSCQLHDEEEEESFKKLDCCGDVQSVVDPVSLERLMNEGESQSFTRAFGATRVKERNIYF